MSEYVRSVIYMCNTITYSYAFHQEMTQFHNCFGLLAMSGCIFSARIATYSISRVWPISNAYTNYQR